MLDNIDIEKIKKLNTLTLEIRKHHIADGSEEALQQARVFIEDRKEVKEAENKISQSIDNQKSYLLEKKFELLLKNNTNKTEQMITELKLIVENLSRELESIKSELNKIPDQFQKKKLKEREESKQKVLKTETKEEHPRQGKYSSDDVKIDQFFYYGKK